LNLIQRMTAGARLPTLTFSLEQPGVELFERMASITTGWQGREIEERAQNEDPELTRMLLTVCADWHQVVTVETPCTLDRIDALIAETRGLKFWTEPLRLVVIDYLGLIGLGARKNASAYEHMSQVAREVKNAAKRHQVGIVLLAQVDREGESGGA